MPVNEKSLANLIPRQKGQPALNPGGRPKLSRQDKALLKKNSSKAIERMEEILDDDGAFGKEGWIPPRDQITILNSAIDRVAGRADRVDVNVEHQHSGTIGVDTARLQEIAAQLPERKAQQRAIDAKVVDAEVIDDKTSEPVDVDNQEIKEK